MAHKEARLITELCQQFYHLGWVTGTGGGISLRSLADPDTIYIAPSGVQKERMHPTEIFLYSLSQQCQLNSPQKHVSDNDLIDLDASAAQQLKMSQCTPLFIACYDLRPRTRACIHTHSIHALMCTLLTTENHITLSHLEMIKGIRQGESKANFTYHSQLTIPIIENTAHERDLEGRLRRALEMYPDTNAVLVRRHGVYVWGESWEVAKTMAECYDYLFECYVKMRQIGLDPAHVPPQCSCVTGDPEH